MLTAAQQHAVDEFAKSLSALGDDALIDTYHQAWEDHTEASAEGSDNLSKTYAKGLATEKAMQDRFPDYQSRLPATLSVNQLVPRPVPIVPIAAYRAATWVTGAIGASDCKERGSASAPASFIAALAIS